MKHYLLALLFLTLIFAGCSKKKDSDPSPSKNVINPGSSNNQNNNNPSDTTKASYNKTKLAIDFLKGHVWATIAINDTLIPIKDSLYIFDKKNLKKSTYVYLFDFRYMQYWLNDIKNNTYVFAYQDVVGALPDYYVNVDSCGKKGYYPIQINELNAYGYYSSQFEIISSGKIQGIFTDDWILSIEKLNEDEALITTRHYTGKLVNQQPVYYNTKHRITKKPVVRYRHTWYYDKDGNTRYLHYNPKDCQVIDNTSKNYFFD